MREDEDIPWQFCTPPRLRFSLQTNMATIRLHNSCCDWQGISESGDQMGMVVGVTFLWHRCFDDCLKQNFKTFGLCQCGTYRMHPGISTGNITFFPNLTTFFPLFSLYDLHLIHMFYYPQKSYQISHLQLAFKPLFQSEIWYRTYSYELKWVVTACS